MKAKAENQTAVLLIAHGSKRAEANADLVQLAELVQARSDYPIVEIAYLELAEPTIPDGAAKCVGQGASRVLMLPYFLSAGNHVTEDLEGYRRRFAREYPGVNFVLCPPLGLHPQVVDAVLARIEEGARR